MKLTAKEIAEAVGISRRAVAKRAKKENWLYIEEKNPNGGKPVKYYIIESLPEDIRNKILSNGTEQWNSMEPENNHNGTKKSLIRTPITENEENNNGTISVGFENFAHCKNGVETGKSEKGSLVHYLLRNQNRENKGTKEPKNSLTKEPKEQDIWLSVAEASKYVGVSERAIRKACQTGKYCSCLVSSNKGRGGKELRVALSSLPESAQVEWVKRNREQAKGLSDSLIERLSAFAVLEIERTKNRVELGSYVLSQEKKMELAEILKMIDEARRVPFGVSKRRHLENVAKKYNRGRSTLERYINIFNKKGIAGLKKIVGRKKQREIVAWDKEALAFMKGVFLRGIRAGNKMSKQKAYEATLEEAKRKGWKVGSKSSAYRYLQEINPLLVKYALGGRLALDNVFYIARRYDDLKPFQVVVGDQHQFDFWVRDAETGEIFRPMGYFFVDARTRLVYGFAFSGKKYSSHTIGLALRMGILSWGFFTTIYTDNGKPEISRYVDSIAEEISAMGAESKDISELYKTKEDKYVVEEDGDVIDVVSTKEEFHKRAGVFNAKAKLIERFFESFEGILADLGVCGVVVNKSDVMENRKESTKRLYELIDKEKLLTYEEFISYVFKAVNIYNNRKHSALKRSPIEELMYAIKNEGFEPVFAANDEDVDIALLARAKRKVHKGRVQINNIIYEAESEITQNNLDAGLWHLADGSEVEVRYDPTDTETAYAILKDGSIRKLKQITYSSMIDDELTASLIKKKRELMRVVIDEYRKFTKSIPDILKYSKVKSFKRKIERKEEENLSDEEILRRIEERKQNPIECDIKPINTRKNITTSSVDRYEQILIKELKGFSLSEEEAFFKAEYEANMSEDERKRWEVFKAFRSRSISV